MKKATMILVALTIGSTVFAQKEIKLDYVEVSGVRSKPINFIYLSKTQEGVIAERVLDLQHKAASFNLKESKLYIKPQPTYLVDFVGDKSHINANYGANGELLQTYESYKNVIFPVVVRNSIYKNNLGWKVVKNTYNVQYNKNDRSILRYKVWLVKDGQKRKVMIDALGNALVWTDYKN